MHNTAPILAIDPSCYKTQISAALLGDPARDLRAAHTLIAAWPRIVHALAQSGALTSPTDANVALSCALR